MFNRLFRSDTTTELAGRQTSLLTFHFTDVTFLEMFLVNRVLLLKVGLDQLFLEHLHSFLWYNEGCCYTAQQVTCRQASVLTDRLAGPPRLPWEKNHKKMI